MNGFTLPRRYLDLHEAAKQRAANAVAMQIAQEVAQVYPGHDFRITVQPDHKGSGTVIIDYDALLVDIRQPVRYVVHNCDDTVKVLKCCGEILERVNLARGKLESRDELDEASKLAPEAFKAK